MRGGVLEVRRISLCLFSLRPEMSRVFDWESSSWTNREAGMLRCITVTQQIVLPRLGEVASEERDRSGFVASYCQAGWRHEMGTDLAL
jgi:hypothetical protein